MILTQLGVLSFLASLHCRSLLMEKADISILFELVVGTKIKRMFVLAVRKYPLLSV